MTDESEVQRRRPLSAMLLARSHFLRPKASGQMAFSAVLLSLSKRPLSRKVCNATR
jgi:hypothetical protein